MTALSQGMAPKVNTYEKKRDYLSIFFQLKFLSLSCLCMIYALIYFRLLVTFIHFSLFINCVKRTGFARTEES